MFVADRHPVANVTLAAIEACAEEGVDSPRAHLLLGDICVTMSLPEEAKSAYSISSSVAEADADIRAATEAQEALAKALARS